MATQQSALTTWRFPPRPNVGTAGRPIQVRANFFPVMTLPGQNLYHYEVTITPDLPPSKNRRVYQLWEDDKLLSGALNGIRPVFDGKKNVFSARALPIPDEGLVYTVDYLEEDEPKS